MIDIAEFLDGDLLMVNFQAPKAANILGIQLGSLEYAPTLGIDLAYFLQNGIRFQNESFQSYIVEVLANNQINVSTLTTVLSTFMADYTLNLSPEEITTGLVAR